MSQQSTDGIDAAPGGGAGAAPGGAGASGPSSALAENWEQKGEMSYYFAHRNTPLERVVTTMGDAPRLLEAFGGSAPAASAAGLPITRYQYCDDGEQVLVYVPWEEALPQEAVTATQPSPTSVLLELTSGGKKHSLHLRGLTGAVTAVVAKAGKTRVVLKLSKAENTPWKTLLKTGAAADDDDF
jgi:hypothetical protein